VQDILETWRLRTPNEWEQLTVWSDVLTWRNAIYNVIINAFKHMGELAPHLHQLGYKDKAWCAPLTDSQQSCSLRCRCCNPMACSAVHSDIITAFKHASEVASHLHQLGCEAKAHDKD